MNDHDDRRHYRFARTYDPYNTLEWTAPRWKRRAFKALAVLTVIVGLTIAFLLVSAILIVGAAQ